MGTNVQKIDLDELKKAREALNAEMGVSTSQPYKEPKSEKKEKTQESYESEEREDVSSVSNTENKSESESSAQMDSQNSLAKIEADDTSENRDFSVYDNFAPFEINTEYEVPTIEVIEEKPVVNQPVENTENLETDEDSDNIDDLMNILDDFLGESDFGEDLDLLDDELLSEEESVEEDVEEKLDEEETLQDVSSEIDGELENIDNEETHKDIEDIEPDTTYDNEEPAQAIKKEEPTQVIEKEDIVSQEEPNLKEKDEEKQSLKEEKQVENTPVSEKEEIKEENNNVPHSSFAIPNVDGKNNKDNEKPNEQAQAKDVKQENIEDFPKQNNALESENNPKEEPVQEEPEEDNHLPKIEDANFIDIIRSKEFMGSDNLTCIYGIDEENDVYCQNFKDFYNTIIFNQTDDGVFNLFSSIIMSLLLKNSKYDVKFVICDAKSGGAFNIYNDLSYMFASRVAESNREINQTLKELCEEIDERYKSLARASVKSIEKFNDEMKKAKIAPMPYILLFFNNFTRASHLDDSHEIDTNLTYILKYGRLVGVYVNLVTFDENISDKINFNMQTRISYKTDLEDSSISQLGEAGAERIADDNEYIIKTLYSDKLVHLKAPNITQKEIELLIKNIEK